MKKHFILSLSILVLITFIISSCTKDPITPIVYTPSCTIIINDTTTITADSVQWDLYNGTTNRIQGFKGGTAIFTCWPGAVSSGTKSLTRQYLYWIDGAIYTIPSGMSGSLVLTNNSNRLDGEINTVEGDFWSGSATHSGNSKIKVSFKNAPMK